MRDLPIIFPISLAVIVLMMFFTGAYAVSESALSDEPVYTSSLAPAGVLTHTGQPPADLVEGDTEHEWYEQAAIFVCPLH